MAKKGLTVDTAAAVLKSLSDSRGWALCIGAGTSYPIFPSWKQLVRRVAAQDGGEETVTGLSEYFERFSPDAVLQAAADRLGLSDAQFAAIISEELYRDFRDALSVKEWKVVARALCSSHLGSLKQFQWEEFLHIINEKLQAVSAVGLARTVAEVVGTPLAPAAVLSFNAEPLFPTLLNAYTAKRRADSGDPSGKSFFDTVTRSISGQRSGRMPYYYCHGLLPIPGGTTSPHKNSVDKLVFSEAQYLQLANNAFAWQSSAFIDVCMSRSIVFIGVSLSDPNMRRWLSWVHACRVSELSELQGSQKVSTTHFWLTVDPGSAIEKRWIESTVAHLGIRLVWIHDWNSAEIALRRLLGLASGNDS